jgi:hypothetical protein
VLFRGSGLVKPTKAIHEITLIYTNKDPNDQMRNVKRQMENENLTLRSLPFG